MTKLKSRNKLTTLSQFMMGGVFIFLIIFFGALFYIQSAYIQYSKYLEDSDLLHVYAEKILYLDEVLTMSARMSSTTGDKKWEERYNNHVGKLGVVLDNFIALAPDVYAKSGVQETDEANNKLVSMETRAFEKVRSSTKQEAYEILFSKEYERQKQIYFEGINNSTRQIDRFLMYQTNSYRSKIQLAIIFLIGSFLLVSVLGIILAIRLNLFSKEFGEEEQLIQKAHNRSVYLLVALLVVGMAMIFWQMTNLAEKIKEDMTKEKAALLIKSLENFRTLYTSEVVNRVRPYGIEVTHDYLKKESAIPLPATLSMKLASLIGEKDIDANVRLYSDYPFPWRLKERGLLNDVDRDILQTIRKNPQSPLLHIENINGRRVLRFSKADIMRQSCIKCHNTHPDSPKTDWKEGDVRGVLEVMLPLNVQRGSADNGLFWIAFLIVFVTVVAVVLVFFTIRRLKRISMKFSEANKSLNDFKYAMDQHTIVGITDVRGKITYANDKFCEISKYSRKELLGQDHRIINSGYHSKKFMHDLWETISHGNVWKGEVKNKAKDGSSYWVQTTILPFMRDNKPYQYIAIRTDITERKIAEEELKETYEKLQGSFKELKQMQTQLLQSEKMASIGQLAAGVAHEINNPVGFIGSNLQSLEGYVKSYSNILFIVEKIKQAVDNGDLKNAKEMVKELKDVEEKVNLNFIMNDIDGLLQESQRGVDRVKKIVLDLRTFSREDSEEKGWSQVEEIMDSVLSMVNNELKYKAEVKKEYSATPQIKCHSQKLGQVFINLLVNASHAIEDKGIITVRTYQEQDNVCIEVSDTGKGILEENLRKIFDPFFTTKKIGMGTGLGLSISYEIVKKHGGEIIVSSELNKGTTFKIQLPIKSQ